MNQLIRIAATAAVLVLQASLARAAGIHELWLEFNAGAYNSRTNEYMSSTTSGCITEQGRWGGTYKVTDSTSLFTTPTTLSFHSLNDILDATFQIACCVEFYHEEITRTEESYAGACLGNDAPYELVGRGAEKTLPGSMRPYWIMNGTVTTKWLEDGVVKCEDTHSSPRLATTVSQFLRAVQGTEHFQSRYADSTTANGTFLVQEGLSIQDFSSATIQSVRKQPPVSQHELGFWMHHSTTELGLQHSNEHLADAMLEIPTGGLRSPGVRVTAASPHYGDDTIATSRLEYLSWSNTGGTAE